MMGLQFTYWLTLDTSPGLDFLIWKPDTLISITQVYCLEWWDDVNKDPECLPFPCSLILQPLWQVQAQLCIQYGFPIHAGGHLMSLKLGIFPSSKVTVLQHVTYRVTRETSVFDQQFGADALGFLVTLLRPHHKFLAEPGVWLRCSWLRSPLSGHPPLL